MVTREVFEPRVADLRALQDHHLSIISDSVNRLLPAAQVEYAHALTVYKSRTEERRLKMAEEQRLAEQLNERIKFGAVDGNGFSGGADMGASMAALPAAAPEIAESAFFTILGSHVLRIILSCSSFDCDG